MRRLDSLIESHNIKDINRKMPMSSAVGLLEIIPQKIRKDEKSIPKMARILSKLERIGNNRNLIA
jgi:hypothetical protein